MLTREGTACLATQRQEATGPAVPPALTQRGKGCGEGPGAAVLLASQSCASAGEPGMTHTTGMHSTRSASLALLMWVLHFCGASN